MLPKTLSKSSISKSYSTNKSVSKPKMPTLPLLVKTREELGNTKYNELEWKKDSLIKRYHSKLEHRLKFRLNKSELCKNLT